MNATTYVQLLVQSLIPDDDDQMFLNGENTKYICQTLEGISFNKNLNSRDKESIFKFYIANICAKANHIELNLNLADNIN